MIHDARSLYDDAEDQEAMHALGFCPKCGEWGRGVICAACRKNPNRGKDPRAIRNLNFHRRRMAELEEVSD